MDYLDMYLAYTMKAGFNATALELEILLWANTELEYDILLQLIIMHPFEYRCMVHSSKGIIPTIWS